MTDYGKIPPQDIDSEVALLGAMLQDMSIVDDVIAGMRPEYFYKDPHQEIFSAMCNVNSRGDKIDMITVSNELRKQEKLEQVGGVVYLADLTKGVTTGYNRGYQMKSIIDKHVRRECIRICNDSIQLNFSDASDISDNLSALNSDLIKIQEAFSGTSRPKKIKDLAEQSVDDYFKRKQLFEKGETTGIPTGIAKLDRVTGGWQDGDSILLAGRTSMGKTAMALHYALSACGAGKSVQFFSLEMTAARLADRMIIASSQVSPDGFKYGDLLPEDEKQLDYGVDSLSKIGCFIDDTTSLNVDQIFARCRIAQKRGECDLVIIDYIGLIPPADRKVPREQQVSEISQRIKKYAKELQIPVITLVQVNRAGEQSADKRPKLSELRESGSLEQDSDLVIFVYRPEYYKIQSIQINSELGPREVSTENMGVAILAKQRNGRVGDILFSHSHGLNVITDYKEP